ncbi:MAG: PAS domain S-box protein [Desulfobacterales bacterium]|nr:PAS domain S-box protein [Desulfobacterales bacterium]
MKKKVEQQTEELRKSEEKYRSLVESAEDFIFTIDSSNHFQSMNSFTANFFGGYPEDFIGKPLSVIFPDKIAEKQQHIISVVFQYGKSVREEFELQVEKHQIWISANFMPIKNDKGEPTVILCIARDITENKNLEKQMISAEKLASLGTLAAGVAHEINNPLGVILGFTDILIRKADKSSQDYEDLKIIERQGLVCKEVVENLLSFARFEGSSYEDSDLNECLIEIIKIVKHILDINNVELIMELSENIPRVKADPRQLQQVFLNLINNAVAAIKGSGNLTIKSYTERSKNKAIVQFHDTGIGIKPEDMDRIYEPFFTTKPEGEGTGLGLFVTYGIISKYGGTIDCVSHYCQNNTIKNSGTIFTIKLNTIS